jgi:hypothetical protein
MQVSMMSKPGHEIEWAAASQARGLARVSRRDNWRTRMTVSTGAAAATGHVAGGDDDHPARVFLTRDRAGGQQQDTHVVRVNSCVHLAPQVCSGVLYCSLFPRSLCCTVGLL